MCNFLDSQLIDNKKSTRWYLIENTLSIYTMNLISNLTFAFTSHDYIYYTLKLFSLENPNHG